MVNILILCIIIIIVGLLAKSGGITPFIAGGIGIGYSSHFHLTYQFTLAITLLLYFIAYYCNSWTEASNRSMTTNINTSGLKADFGVVILKAAIIMLFILLPIPKPPFYLVSIPAIILTSTLLYTNNHEDDYLSWIIPVILQTILFAFIGGLLERYSTSTTPTMALIAAIALPNLLFEHDMNTYYANSYADPNELNLHPIPWIFAFFISWITPGFSSSIVSKSIFQRGHSVTFAALLIEAALEGWTVHIALLGDITTKSPLGDLLALPSLEWNTFTPTNSTRLILFIIPVIAAIITGLIPTLNLLLPKTTSAIIITAQAIIFSGSLATIVYISLGIIFSRCMYSKDESNRLNLLFISQSL